MKKRNVLALALALVMSVGMSSSVFAATWSGSAPKENDVEKVTYNFMNETKSGKYKLVDTATLKNWVDKKDKMIVVAPCRQPLLTTSSTYRVRLTL